MHFKRTAGFSRIDADAYEKFACYSLLSTVNILSTGIVLVNDFVCRKLFFDLRALFYKYCDYGIIIMDSYDQRPPGYQI